MAEFVCIELVGNVCTKWQALQSTSMLAELAITKQQAGEIIKVSLLVVFNAWGIKQVLNVIQRRRY